MGVEDSVREPRQKSMTASLRLPTPTTSTGSVAREAPSAAARTPWTRRRLRLLRPRVEGSRRRGDVLGWARGGGRARPLAGAAMGDEDVWVAVARAASEAVET